MKLNIRVSRKLAYLTDECIDHGQKGNEDGYGHASGMRLHRKVFFVVNGFLPDAVMHSCDNPRCINPRHLVAGNHAANNKDRANKGRSAKERHDLRKLTLEQVAELRARFAKRTRRDPVNGPCALAKEFGIDSGAVYQIGTGRTYR